MKTTLRQSKFTMPCQHMNGTSTLPALSKLDFRHRNGDSGLSEDDELFIGYGYVPSAFPYKMQDAYTRELYPVEMNGIVLENKYLKAVFLPEWGGKLMSLTDKTENKELLYHNPVMRTCNLAIRNAWTSGGVEWNCGMFGHHVNTCETMFTTTTHLDDGTPVLRMYEYNRIRRVVQQMDFFLPDDSKLLFARNRIINPLPDVIPMYWWSNIAIPETPDTRVVVDADSAYVADNNISLAPLPEYKNDDVTYPYNVPAANDYFYNIPHKKRKFEAALNEDGNGFIHTSTYRLKGRKLFCWGQNPGGDRWQAYLTADGSTDRYIELQAGLAYTQYECLPMPPYTTWEWLEGYGALSADRDRVHGEWEGAKAEVRERLNEIITDDEMDEILAATKKMATSHADGELLFRGSGWCALENIRRDREGKPRIACHLDFGEPGTEQADWLNLLEKGRFLPHRADEVPASWMLQEEWTALMQKNVADNPGDWYARLQLGITYVVMGRLNEAWNELQASMELSPSCWAKYGMSQVKRVFGDEKSAAVLCMEASRMNLSDVSLAKEALELSVKNGYDKEAIELACELPESVLEIGRVKIYMILAYIHIGNIEKAESLFYGNGGIVLPDVREGELIITETYLLIEELKAKRDGIEFNKETAYVPPEFDYRQCGTEHRRAGRIKLK